MNQKMIKHFIKNIEFRVKKKAEDKNLKKYI